MSAFLDDISRIIASPIPRRRALRLLGGAMGGGVLTYLGLGRASHGLGVPAPDRDSDRDSDRDRDRCDDDKPVRCNRTCYPSGYTCCGGTVCDNDDQCCTDHCCRKRQTCCGQTCCRRHEQCCTDHCCSRGGTCCGNHCCDSGEVCCNGVCKRERPSPSNPCG